MNITQKLMKVKKKISDHDHDKYIATPEFNSRTEVNGRKICCKLAQVNLASKSDIANFVKKTDFDDKKVTSNKKKNIC